MLKVYIYKKIQNIKGNFNSDYQTKKIRYNERNLCMPVETLHCHRLTRAGNTALTQSQEWQLNVLLLQ